MKASFVVRLLTAAGDLLAWTMVEAESRPQGRPRSTPFHALAPSKFVIEQNGLATQLSIHWADLDVARVTPLMEATQVQVGQTFQFAWWEPVWMVKGADSDVPLPQVTVRESVTVKPPPAAMGAVAPR